MSLLLGNPTQQVVSFGSAEAQYFQDVIALQELEVAAADFHSAAALDASYLVYIGTSPLIVSIYLLILSKVLVHLLAHSPTRSFGFTLEK